MNTEEKTTDSLSMKTDTIKDIRLPKESTDSKTPEIDYNSIENISGDSPVYIQTPEIEAKIKRDESEAKKNKAISSAVSFIKYSLGLAITIGLAIWAIYVANMVKPVASLEEKYNRMEKDIININGELSNLKNLLSNTREEFLKKAE